MVTPHPHFGSALRRLARALSLGLIAVTAPVPGQPEEPDTSDEVQVVLARIASAEFATLRAEIRLESQSPVFVQPPGATGRAAVTLISVVLARPNRFRLTVTSPSPDGDGLTVSDGERAMYASQMLRQVAETEAPPDLGAVDLADLALTGAGASVLLPAAMGIRPPVLVALTATGEATAHVLAPQEIEGALCDVVALMAERGGETMALRLFVDRASGLLRRSEMTMETLFAGQAAQVTEEFVTLELDGPVTEADFEAEPPPGLQRVPALDAGAMIRRFGVESP
jgi:outer membrane lipoprotein-sorting protein